jgi:SNF2 family DNA or RNA helicase
MPKDSLLQSNQIVSCLSKMNTVRTVRTHMELFQQTFSHALTESSPQAPQPPHITLPLRPHQLSALAAMKTYEETLRYGMPIENHGTLFSQFAFLGDATGTGKTMTALGHISQLALAPLRTTTLPMSNLHPESTPMCFSVLTEPDATTLFDTLIVVPFTLYRQWQTAITTHTSLKACFLHQQRDIDKDTLTASVSAAHLTLISNTLLSSFLVNLRVTCQPVWRRVLYDDADIIKIPASIPPRTHFTWILTSRFENFLFSNQACSSHVLRQLPESFIETLHPELQSYIESHRQTHPSLTAFRVQSQTYFNEILRNNHPLRSRLVIRSSRAAVTASAALPPLQETTILCETPTPFAIVSVGLPAEVEAALHAGDIQEALTRLNVPSHTPLTLVQAVLEFHQQKAPHHVAALQERLEQVSKDMCSVCFEEPKNPCITPCCSRVFCGGCILQWLKRSAHCPLCRDPFQASQLIAIGESRPRAQPVIQPRPLKKREALLQILQDHPQGQFVIFSHYETPFLELEEQIAALSITVDHLAGPSQNKDGIAKRLADFEAGRIRVLLISNRTAVLGMNILAATHILLLHKMVPEEEKQILGCSYRMGRTRPLHCIKLYHEREMQQQQQLLSTPQ